jgi:hypothetical protein
MSTVLTGNSSNITTVLTATVTAMANNGAGAIRVTTSAPHLFGNNDLTYVSAGSTDGFFNITVIDSTHFDLQGSTFSFTAVGKALDLSLTPQIQVPTDGDTFSAQLSGLLSAFQGILDRTQSLQAQVTLNELVATAFTPNFFPSSAPFSSGTASIVMSTYTATGWDWFTDKWLVGGQTISSLVGVVQGAGDPAAWVSLNGASSGILGVVTDICRGAEIGVANRYVYAVGITSGSPEVYRGDTQSTSWFSNSIVGVSTSVTQLKVASLNSAVVTTIAAGSGDSNVFYSTDHGATWTAQTAVVFPRAVLLWSLAQSSPGAGTLAAFPYDPGSGNFVLTTTGNTWSNGNVPLLTGTEGISAACYTADRLNQTCLLVATSNTISGNTTFYRSYDSIHWNVVLPTNFPAGLSLTGMAAVGRMIVGLVNDVGGGSLVRVVFSIDGGVTWSACTEVKAVGALSLGSAPSPNGFNLVTGIGVLPSIRFGLPGGFGKQ